MLFVIQNEKRARKRTKGAEKCFRPLDEIFPMTRAKEDSTARSRMKWNSTSSRVDRSTKL